MTREEIENSMTLKDAIEVFKSTNAYGTMDIAKSVILKALEQKPCEDCVSRQEVLDVLKDEWNTCLSADDAMLESIDTIKALKSVTPQQMTGHWIDGVCSECGWDAGQEAFSEDANFCMKCGVKMLPIGAEKENVE